MAPLLLLLGCFQLSAATVTLEFILPSPDDQNVIRFQCINEDGFPDPGARFNFRTSTSSMKNLRTDVGQNYRTYTITSEKEGFVFCTIGDESSDPVVFAAVPTVSNQTVCTDVFRGTRANLRCPIPLPTVRMHLNYSITWERIENSSAVQLADDPESNGFMLLDNSRNLSIPVSNLNDQRVYRCKLSLTRCNLTASDRCVVHPPIEGPSMKFNVFEGIEGRASPELLSVTNGQLAMFQCSGKGTNITMRWIFNESTCDIDSCGHNGISIKMLEDNISSVINTTLEIRTGELHSNIMEKQDYNIQCIVEQNLQYSTLMTNDVIVIVELTVNPALSSAATPNTTVTRPLSTSSSETPTTVAIGIGVSAGVAAVILLLYLIVFVCGMMIYFRKKRSTSESGISHVSPRYTHNNRIYEEIPASAIAGTENITPAHHPFSRQYGIECDPNNPKAKFLPCGSEEPPCYQSRSECCSCNGSEGPPCNNSRSGGSDLSGLSGVSGNIPGAHKMPTFGHDATDSLLVPPRPWERRHNSDSSFHTGSSRTNSTYIPSTSNSCQNICSLHHHGNTEVCCQHGQHHATFHRHYSSSGVNVCATEHNHPPFPLSNGYDDQFLCCGNPHNHVSHASSTQSFCKRSVSDDSRSTASHLHSVRNIPDAVLLEVMTCLMHNKECELPDCPCHKLQGRYNHMQDLISQKQVKTSECRQKKSSILVSSSSTESDSDVTDITSKRAAMRLKLTDAKKLHPHYHISTKSHVRRTSDITEIHRRSRSLSDLTPITEVHEGHTPIVGVGGPIKPETPIRSGNILGDNENGDHSCGRPTKEELLSQTTVMPLSKPKPPLLREISLSSDNLPVLCLNDCLLQLKTPSPRKPYSRNLGSSKAAKRCSNKSVLTPLQESNGTETDDSNTSSRSESSTETEVIKSSLSDDDDIGNSDTSNWNNSVLTKIGGSSGYESQEIDMNSSATISLRRDSYFKNESCKLKSHDPSYASLSRSCSPFETETCVSSDGTVTIQTTEC